MKDFFRAQRPHRGLSYEDYLEKWQQEAEAPVAGLDKEARKMHHYVAYNRERSEHVHAAYEPSARLREAMAQIEAPQLWMVLTEAWCGDSAFCLPVLVEAARLSKHVTLRILLRDDNLDIMDAYLSASGGRSIPKLVAFGEEGTELFQWGPRPEAAQALFDRERAAGKDKDAIVQALIAWYEDGGWQEVDRELADAIEHHYERA